MTLQDIANEIVQLKATYPKGDAYANSRVAVMNYELKRMKKSWNDVVALINKGN